MTRAYEWNPMPHVLDVRCPACGEQATFEFAEWVTVKKVDQPFFAASKLFELRQVEHSGHRRHVAVFFHGLHGLGTAIIRELPEGYVASDWDHSRYLYRSHGSDLGAVRCSHCGTRRVHTLQWPSDAWYQLDYHQHTLWAFHREAAQDLRAFIASSDRQTRDYRWAGMLMKVPGHFLTAKARPALLAATARWA